MEQTLCIYNRPLRHTEKGTKRKIKYKSRYYDRPCNRIVQNNAI